MTRIELAETLINMIEYISGETLKRRSSSQFKDTTSKVATLAYDLGFIDLSLLITFDPYGEVTPVTLAKSIAKIKVFMDYYGYN